MFKIDKNKTGFKKKDIVINSHAILKFAVVSMFFNKHTFMTIKNLYILSKYQN